MGNKYLKVARHSRCERGAARESRLQFKVTPKGNTSHCSIQEVKSRDTSYLRPWLIYVRGVLTEQTDGTIRSWYGVIDTAFHSNAQ